MEVWIKPDLMVLDWTFFFFLLSLLVCLRVSGPHVHFGADDEVLGALLQVESVSAAAMRLEKPRLSHFNSTLQT